MSEPLTNGAVPDEGQAPDSEIPKHLSFLAEDQAEAEPEEAEQKPAPPPELTPEEVHERGLRREVTSLRSELRARDEQYAQQLETIRQQFLRANQPTEPEPDKDDDPASWVVNQVRRTTDPVNQRLEGLEGRLDQQAQIERIKGFRNAVVSEVSSFREQHADYDDALAHAREYASREIAAREGWDLDYTRAYVVNVGEQIFALKAKARGATNVGEEVYKYAQAVGYQPGGNGRPPTQQPPPSGTRAAAVAHGVAAARRPAGRGAAPGSGTPSAANFDTLSREEQLRIASDPEAWESLFRV
jgi:hypothetical protein